MTRYALMHGDVVATVVEQDHLPTIAGEWVELPMGGPGYVRVGDAFEPPADPPRPRFITVGAFFDRFGPLKYAILASDAPAVRALVKDCEVRRYIDLDNQALPAGLALLQGAGFEIDADAIVHGEIEPDERP